MKLTSVVGNLKRLLTGDQAEPASPAAGAAGGPLPADLLSVLAGGGLSGDQVDRLLDELAGQSPEAGRAVLTGVLAQVARGYATFFL